MEIQVSTTSISKSFYKTKYMLLQIFYMAFVMRVFIATRSLLLHFTQLKCLFAQYCIFCHIKKISQNRPLYLPCIKPQLCRLQNCHACNTSREHCQCYCRINYADQSANKRRYRLNFILFASFDKHFDRLYAKH